MPNVITGAEIRTCLGDSVTTYKALVEGISGVSPLRFHDTAKLNVSHAYQIDDGDIEPARRVAAWLSECVAVAVTRAGLDATTRRVTAIVGTGLRELRSVERFTADGVPVRPDELHFAAAVREAVPGVQDVITVSNACSASGHALAIAADLLAADEADAVIVAGCDATTESMLTMIGRVADDPTVSVRPFDRDRTGVLLGEGAAAVVLEKEGNGPVVLGIGLSCDAYHETAPDVRGIVAAMRDAHERAGVTPGEIDLVLAHGTGTALNDPTEASALTEVFAESRPLVTGIKGAIGHTSGAAALMSIVLAVEAVREGRVPPVTGLRTPIEEAADLRLVVGQPEPISGSAVVQVDAFGFGGVNAVCVLEVAG